MTKKTKDRIKKIVPIVATGVGVTVIGVCAYKKGTIKGMNKGVEYAIKHITDYLTTKNHFSVYKNSKGVPTFLAGIELVEENADVICKVANEVWPFENPDEMNNFKDQLLKIFANGGK